MSESDNDIEIKVETGLRVSLTQAAPIPLDVTLACPRGELLALVGPSGSGKSTVLRCIAGLHRPRQGTVESGGRTWLDTQRSVNMSPQQRRVGFVFQSYALFPHLSAIDNVAIAIDNATGQAKLQRAATLLARVNMEGLEARLPNALSGGQRQRVALARALARDPDVLLLDEPFSAVDQVTRRRLQRELAQLRRELAMPVVLVTHDLEEAQLLSDRLCVLHRGNTLQEGPTAELMRAPESAEVAQLLDQGNLFTADVVRHEEAAHKTWIRWGEIDLECAFQPVFEVGETVDWLVPRAEVILHRQDRPSRGEHENPVTGEIAECVALGDDVQVQLAVPHVKRTVAFTVSRHVASRNSVSPGRSIGVSLLATGIHLMKRKDR